MTGFLLLNKPKGRTSYSAVAAVKHFSGEKRVGHTGTLDPMATGVLPVFLGRATALSSALLDADKTYIARVKLGVSTDTCDITGKVLEERKVTLKNEDIPNLLKSFEGEIMQTPPIYSAIKQNGVRLYELARKGEQAEIPERKVFVRSIKQTGELDENGEFTFCATVSKGTYIRSLCRDIGEKAGCLATMSELCRTETAGFGIENCVTLEEIEQNGIERYLRGCDSAVMHLSAVRVTQKQAKRFCNGGQLDFDRLKGAFNTDNELFRVYFEDNFLGLGRADIQKSQLAVKCVVFSL